MIKTTSKSKKSISKSTYILLSIIALVALVGFYIKSMMVSPQVALIAEPSNQMCITNINSMSFHDECGIAGTFKRALYTCNNGSTAEKLASGTSCISYGDILIEAQNNCGQTCTGPSPAPSCVPNPCPADGRECKLMALPEGQVYCPAETALPTDSITTDPLVTKVVDANGCYYQPVQCVKAPCESIKVCPTTTTTPNGTIPLGCVSWFDGCNTCQVKDGLILGCTKMACRTDAQMPYCKSYDEASPKPSLDVATPVPTAGPGCYTEQRFCIQSLVGGNCPTVTICPSATPTPTPVPSPVYSSIPSSSPTGLIPVYSSKPSPSLVPSPFYTPRPTAVPTLAPRSVTRQSFAQCYKICRNNKRGAVSCVRYCMR